MASRRRPKKSWGFSVQDRREHVREVIRPALAAGRWVVCDRYVASTCAYQASAGVQRELLTGVLRDPDAPPPDLTLWLRLPVTRGLARIARQDKERFERVRVP